VLFNHEKKVFVGERTDRPGAWQLPQGGIDSGESIEDAFFRELKEEIGTDKAEILRIHDEILRYELPPHLTKKLWEGKYIGQEQTWIAAKFIGDDSDINLFYDKFPEFNSYKWIALDEILDFIVPFKKDTYKKVIDAFQSL